MATRNASRRPIPARGPTKDPVPIGLQEISVKRMLLISCVADLMLLRSLLTTATLALRYQNGDNDSEIANALSRLGIDGLTDQIGALNKAIGKDDGGWTDD